MPLNGRVAWGQSEPERTLRYATDSDGEDSYQAVDNRTSDDLYPAVRSETGVLT